MCNCPNCVRTSELRSLFTEHPVPNLAVELSRATGQPCLGPARAEVSVRSYGRAVVVRGGIKTRSTFAHRKGVSVNALTALLGLRHR